MSEPIRPSRFRRLVLATGFAAVLVYALFIVFRSHPQNSRRAAPVTGGALDPGPDTSVVERALAIAGFDSTALKTAWVDEVDGHDVSALTPAQRALFVRVANARPCLCGCGYTLAACRRYDRTCPDSGPAAEALLDSIRGGHITSADGLREPPVEP